MTLILRDPEWYYQLECEKEYYHPQFNECRCIPCTDELLINTALTAGIVDPYLPERGSTEDSPHLKVSECGTYYEPVPFEVLPPETIPDFDPRYGKKEEQELPVTDVYGLPLDVAPTDSDKTLLVVRDPSFTRFQPVVYQGRKTLPLFSGIPFTQVVEAASNSSYAGCIKCKTDVIHIVDVLEEDLELLEPYEDEWTILLHQAVNPEYRCKVLKYGDVPEDFVTSKSRHPKLNKKYPFYRARSAMGLDDPLRRLISYADSLSLNPSSAKLDINSLTLTWTGSKTYQLRTNAKLFPAPQGPGAHYTCSGCKVPYIAHFPNGLSLEGHCPNLFCLDYHGGMNPFNSYHPRRYDFLLLDYLARLEPRLDSGTCPTYKQFDKPFEEDGKMTNLYRQAVQTLARRFPTLEDARALVWRLTPGSREFVKRVFFVNPKTESPILA